MNGHTFAFSHLSLPLLLYRKVARFGIVSVASNLFAKQLMMLLLIGVNKMLNGWDE